MHVFEQRENTICDRRRFSLDMDVLIQIPENKIKLFIDFLKRNDFFASGDDLKMAFEEKSHCTIEDKKSIFRLDVKGIYTEFDEETLKRRRAFNYKGTKLYIASPEDTIASKLLFGSEQDVKDAEGIYVRQKGKLDLDYLMERCRKLDVYDKFLALKKKVEKIENELSKSRKNY
ncbi:MAG: hypothetical protein QMC98_04515 [Candidatus Thermoplasmatota archaeon]|nr:hypothetical protein [Candidatus Thermoplasmatota archaeon]